MNFKYALSGLLFTFIFLISCSEKGELILVRDGETDYVIVIAADADSVIIKASFELQKYLEQISGIVMPVITDLEPAGSYEILVGTSGRMDEGLRNEISILHEDGFIIRTVDKKLIIAGGKDQGTRYGVYTFLEEYLGCRKYSAEVTYVPKHQQIAVGYIMRKEGPAFDYRELHFPDPIHDEDYRNWHKLDVKKGKDEWGMFVHTFDDLVPPEKYFHDHPEYFSFLNVQRIPDGQLCLSNPEVLRLVIRGLEERMKVKPMTKYWSVSQNDTYKACECEHCRELYKVYGGYSGAMIWFVNSVAAEFPDKIISTLAYQYTRPAPVNIKPALNVNIMFCSIECNRSRSLADDTLSASFRKDAEDWCALTNNIFMWDYVVQFRNMVSPFPNLRVLQPNLRYFRDRGMKMMFQQGTGGNISEFYELRQYLIAKLLWNPDVNIDSVMSDFLIGYYGSAAGKIGEYINLMHDALEQSGGELGIYGYPFDGFNSYLTPELIRQYVSLIDQAEAEVSTQPELLKRVKLVRLPLDFAILDISLRNVNEELSYFRKIGDEYVVKQEMIAKLESLTKDAESAGIKRFWEHGNAPQEYRGTVLNYINRSFQNNFALFKPVELLNPPSEKYPVGGAKALTDGLKGVNDYHFNWLGFEGADLEAVIDLEQEQQIYSIALSFLQDIQSWVFMPVEIRFFVSADHKNFTLVKTLTPCTLPRQSGALVEDFIADIPPVKAKHVKIYAKNMGTCPPWHPGFGYPSWIFCDELMIK